ncbi:MAG: PaaX family transcriptional regulator, partial [Pseudonocardia sp.]|nr:PaaX family transcriptional regulator [Pseudonocardia sp.]
ADGWVMAVFSVPESERQKRHMLRSRLAWLGFGTVASGVWIAPAHLEPETRDVLERYDLTSYVNLFRAEHVAFGPVREQIGAWWDLAGLERLYDDFVSVHGPVLARWRRRRADDDARAFADYVRALTDWRRLPFLDPGLPVELLPKTWRAAGAADTFFALQDLLADPARRHVGHVTGR